MVPGGTSARRRSSQPSRWSGLVAAGYDRPAGVAPEQAPVHACRRPAVHGRREIRSRRSAGACCCAPRGRPLRNASRSVVHWRVRPPEALHASFGAAIFDPSPPSRGDGAGRGSRGRLDHGGSSRRVKRRGDRANGRGHAL